VREHGAPIVIKADGLAAGKGVVVALTLADAEQALRDMLGGHAFGNASARVVIEEFLDGEEASYIVMSDGSHALPMASSQDHKRRDEGDLGPNTGGMGAYSPAPVVTPAVEQRILKEVIEPTLHGMAGEGAPFIGFLYAGLMIDKSGAPKVIEFNVRFGDPETQPILLRLKSDLVDLIEAALDGELRHTRVQWDSRPAIGVVVAAEGYPGRVRGGDPIAGLDGAFDPTVKVFHAGTRLDAQGRVATAGGRVLTVCARLSSGGRVEGLRAGHDTRAHHHVDHQQHADQHADRADGQHRFDCRRGRVAAVEQEQAGRQRDCGRLVQPELGARQAPPRRFQPQPVDDPVDQRQHEADQQHVGVRHQLPVIVRRGHVQAQRHAGDGIAQRPDQVFATEIHALSPVLKKHPPMVGRTPAAWRRAVGRR